MRLKQAAYDSRRDVLAPQGTRITKGQYRPRVPVRCDLTVEQALQHNSKVRKLLIDGGVVQ
jgi:hypothetical protein